MLNWFVWRISKSQVRYSQGQVHFTFSPKNPNFMWKRLQLTQYMAFTILYIIFCRADIFVFASWGSLGVPIFLVAIRMENLLQSFANRSKKKQVLWSLYTVSSDIFGGRLVYRITIFHPSQFFKDIWALACIRATCTASIYRAFTKLSASFKQLYWNL